MDGKFHIHGKPGYYCVITASSTLNTYRSKPTSRQGIQAQQSLGKTRYSLYSSCCSTDFKAIQVQ